MVARSSAEAEYRAMAITIYEIIWLRWLLSELDIPQLRPTKLICDNQAIVQMSANLIFHDKMKQAKMDC